MANLLADLKDKIQSLEDAVAFLKAQNKTLLETNLALVKENDELKKVKIPNAVPNLSKPKNIIKEEVTETGEGS